jgi:hypothetical protein
MAFELVWGQQLCWQWLLLVILSAALRTALCAETLSADLRKKNRKKRGLGDLLWV